VTYDAVIDVDNNDLKLRPGMTANVTFVWAEKDDVLRAPNAALRFRPSSEILTALGMPPLGASGDGAAARLRGGGAGGLGATPSGSVQGRRAGDPSAPSGGPSRARDEAPDRRAAWLLRAGRPQSVQVRTGISDGSLTEIVEGELHQGDLVVIDATVAGQTGAPAAGGTPPGSPGGMRRMF
jgi:HlyD family secretion protein